MRNSVIATSTFTARRKGGLQLYLEGVNTKIEFSVLGRFNSSGGLRLSKSRPAQFLNTWSDMLQRSQECPRTVLMKSYVLFLLWGGVKNAKERNPYIRYPHSGTRHAYRLSLLGKNCGTVETASCYHQPRVQWHHRGGSQRREPRKYFFKNPQKVSWTRNMKFLTDLHHVLHPRNHTSPMVNACALEP